MGKIQEFLNNYPVIFNPIQNYLKMGIVEIKKTLKSRLDYSSMKNLKYWVDADIYKKLKFGANDKTLEPEVRQMYKDKLKEVDKYYKNSKIEGTAENLVKTQVQELMKWAEVQLTEAIEFANRNIRGTKEYDLVIDSFKKSLIKDYVPNVLKEKAFANISQERTTMRRIDALVEKEVIKIAKENVNARPQFRKGKRRGKYYKDAVNKEINRLKYKEGKEIREKVEHEYLERIDSGDFTAKSKHLMQRGESQELFLRERNL